LRLLVFVPLTARRPWGSVEEASLLFSCRRYGASDPLLQIETSFYCFTMPCTFPPTNFFLHRCIRGRMNGPLSSFLYHSDLFLRTHRSFLERGKPPQADSFFGLSLIEWLLLPEFPSFVGEEKCFCHPGFSPLSNFQSALFSASPSKLDRVPPLFPVASRSFLE